jgi:Na+/melibiose symporter-like transporter
MGDHFWPSMYPGLIVGALLGLSRGGLMSTLAGAAGGLAGAVATYFVVDWLGFQESVVSLLALVAGATAGAHLCERAVRYLCRAAVDHEGGRGR